MGTAITMGSVYHCISISENQELNRYLYREGNQIIITGQIFQKDNYGNEK